MKNLETIAIISQEINPQYGGQNGLTYDLVQHLKTKYQLTLFCHKISDDLKQDSRICWEKVPMLPGPAIFGLLSFPVSATSKLLGKKFDLTICVGAMSFIFDVNILHFVHGGLHRIKKQLKFELGLYQELILIWNRIMEIICYRKYRHYLTVSDKLKNELQEIYGLRNITTLWNTVTSKHRVPTAAETRSLPVPATPAKILFVGDLNRDIKNFKTLIAALQKIQNHQYLLQICAFISPTKWQKIQKQLQGISYQYLGLVKNMPEIYSQAHILAHPCVYEPCSLAMLESYLAGLRVICAAPYYSGATRRIQDQPGVWALKNPMDMLELFQAIQATLTQKLPDRIFFDWDTPAQLQQRYENEFLRIFKLQRP